MNYTKKLFLFFAFYYLLVGNMNAAFSQGTSKSDSLIHSILNENQSTGLDDQGALLLKTENYSEANQYFSSEIEKNEANREAYFKRGAVRWELNDTVNACRDWSAVLALGDTATFLLLDKKCHGTMTLQDETVPSVRYHQLWASDKKDSQTTDLSHVKSLVDEMPQFPGGDMALIEYFQDNMKYPASAKKKNVQGRVYVNFIIGKTGKVMFPYVVRGIGAGCDEEAVRLVKNMPAWKPGKLHKKPVLVRFNVPVKFSLN